MIQLYSLAAVSYTHLVICDDNMMIEGIFTDGDLRRVFDMGVDVRQLSIADVMTPGGIRVRPGILAVEALNLMQSRHSTSVMVADGDHLLGVLPVSYTHLLRLLIAFVFLCRQSGFHHPHRFYGFFDVMNTNDVLSLIHILPALNICLSN